MMLLQLTWPALAALYALTSFFIRIPYYALSELVWNGRTLGKRMVGIRVISLDGRRLTAHQIVARNLMKEVEVFLPIAFILSAPGSSGAVSLLLLLWFIGVLFVPVLNRRRQRLGDMLADTIVVDTPRAVLLPDLSRRLKADDTGGARHSANRAAEFALALTLSALDAVLDGRDDDAGLARPRARQHAQVTVLMLDDRALRSVGLERRGLRLRPVESDPLGHATSTPHGWDRQPANPARPPGTSPFI